MKKLNMKKLIALLIVLCLPATSAAFAATVTDHNGNEVTLPESIERIAVCDVYPLPAVLTVFFDSAEKLVGIAPASMSAAKNGLLSELYPEILNAETGFLTDADVHVEELMRLNPDIVFYSASNPALGEKLTNAGFCAVAVSATKWKFDAMETLRQWISLFSEIFSGNDKAEKVALRSEEVYEFVRSRIADLEDSERRRVFFLFQYNDSTLMTSGKKFYGEWWANAIGAENVGGALADANSVAVNLEQVYEWNPDLIFITNFTTAQPKDLYENTVGNYDWSGIRAVEDSEVYKMPLGMYRSYLPGVDTPITLLWMAKTAYPELFSDVDITDEVMRYYRDIFGIELTREQAESIFAPMSEAGKL